MYYHILLFIFVFVTLSISLVFLLFHRKKKKLIQKICHLSVRDKCRFLNELVEPLGYRYDIQQDIFTSMTDAWQKYYGYSDMYDRFAPCGNMIFDCQPVYFNYAGKTWLIEFWKGQYGINIGSELGVYCADSIVPPEKWKTTKFKAVPEYEFLDMRTELLYKGTLVANLSAAHWWLTIFSMGRFSRPRDLTLNLSIRFPNQEMRDAFADALIRTGSCEPDSVCTYFGTVTFSFVSSVHKPCFLTRILRAYVLLKNRVFCWLYNFVTRPFCHTCDKLLYLYLCMPFAFRRMLQLKRFRKPPRRKKGDSHGLS